jgi:serine/threonine protein kinase
MKTLYPYQSINFARKKEKTIRVGAFRRGGSFVNPFNRRQQVTIEGSDDTAKNARQAKLALAAVGAIYGAGALYSARKVIPNIASKLRKKAYANAARKALPAPKIGEGVYATVQDISESQVGKVYKPFSQSTKVTILKNGQMKEEAVKLYSKPVGEIIKGRDKEFGLLKELQDTGVVPKIGSKGKFGYTMEKVKGDTLHDLVHNKIQNPSDNQLLSLGREVGAALKKVHNKGILHGDLHSNNILIDGKGKVKIIDLGLGRKSAYKPGTPGFLNEAQLDTTRLVSGGFSSNKKWREKFSEGFYQSYKFSFEPYSTINFKVK